MNRETADMLLQVLRETSIKHPLISYLLYHIKPEKAMQSGKKHEILRKIKENADSRRTVRISLTD